MNNLLPKDLISINNACIDYACGRTSSVPQDINKLFNWHYEEYLSHACIVCPNEYQSIEVSLILIYAYR